MKRFFASLLLALFSVSLITPALLADSDANLPACCRRLGLHHCSIVGQRAGSAGARIDIARCPQFPGTRAVPASAKLSGLTRSFTALFASIAGYSATRAQSVALYRISYSRAGQKRGPPSLVA